jgi:type VI secretion system ImpA/VasJ family protein
VPSGFRLPLKTLLRPVAGAPHPGGDWREHEPHLYARAERALKWRVITDVDEDGLPYGLHRPVQEDPDGSIINDLIEATSNKVKDLRLGKALVLLIVRDHGLAVLGDGIEFIYKLLQQFWNELYPRQETDGGLYRCSVLKHFMHDLAGELEHDDLVKAYRAGALAPSLSAQSAVFLDNAVSATSRSVAQLTSLSALTNQKFADEAQELERLAAPLLQEIKSIEGVLKQVRKLKGGETKTEKAMPKAKAGSDAQSEPVSSERQPTNADSLITELIDIAHRLRSIDSTNPVPYLILRAVRWGELRAQEFPEKADKAVPERARRDLAQLAQNRAWIELLSAAEKAAGTESGRACLDIHRYSIVACDELQYATVARALRSELRALLDDCPKVRESKLNDGTPASTAETLEWIEAQLGKAHPALGRAVSEVHHGEESQQESIPGRLTPAAAKMNATETGWSCERERFQKRLDVAKALAKARHCRIALPILRELSYEIERRQLTDWEEPILLLDLTTLQYTCMKELGIDDTEFETVFRRLCTLDPKRALSLEVEP